MFLYYQLNYTTRYVFPNLLSHNYVAFVNVEVKWNFHFLVAQCEVDTHYLIKLIELELCYALSLRLYNVIYLMDMLFMNDILNNYAF